MSDDFLLEVKRVISAEREPDAIVRSAIRWSHVVGFEEVLSDSGECKSFLFLTGSKVFSVQDEYDDLKEWVIDKSHGNIGFRPEQTEGSKQE